MIFKTLNFVNMAGAICEEENHHADFEIGWGRKGINLDPQDRWLDESDFILAAKLDSLG